jgi:hypothetical protein
LIFFFVQRFHQKSLAKFLLTILSDYVTVW